MTVIPGHNDVQKCEPFSQSELHRWHYEVNVKMFLVETTTMKLVSSPASGYLGENPTLTTITSWVFGSHVTLRAASHVSMEVALRFESANPQSLLSPSPEHLSEDAADAPQVHWCGVAGLEQHLGGSVPERHHLQHKHTATCQRATKPPNKMG